MAFNKTINLLLFDGNPNGMMMCQLSNWDGCVYKIPRTDLNQFLKRKRDCGSTGIYFLFGIDELGKESVYIGEGEDIANRIKQQIDNSLYWTECVAIVSKEDHLNKAHAKHMEYEFYNLARTVNRYEVTNNNTPTRSSISEYDDAMVKEFMNNTKLLVSTLGYKVFDSLEKESETTKESPLFFLSGARGAKAQGSLSSEGFIVFKGSEVAKGVSKSFKTYKDLRKKLFEDGTIDKNNIFTKDYLFASPSAAAAVVLGRSANGLTEWQTEDSRTLKGIEE